MPESQVSDMCNFLLTVMKHGCISSCVDIADLETLVYPDKAALSSRCLLQSAGADLLLHKCLVYPSGSHGSSNLRMLVHYLFPKGWCMHETCRIAEHAAALSMERQLRYQIAALLSGIARQLDVYTWLGQRQRRLLRSCIGVSASATLA